MPRHDLKAYTSVIARIPQALADEVKQYASQHRCTVSELIRDGLEMRLEAGEVPGRTTGHHGEEVLQGHTEVLHGITEVLQALKALAPMGEAAVRQTITEVLHEVLHGITEVFPLVQPLTPAPQVTEGHTTVIPLVPTVSQEGVQPAEGITEVLPMAPTIPEPSEVLQDVIPHIPTTEPEGLTEVVHDRIDFDHTRFALGKLCVNGHAYQGTGQTLYRLPKYVCLQCDAARARERRARRTAAAREG